MDQDHYAVLAVAPTADLDTIRSAFRAKIMQCHPDRGGSPAQMVQLNAAWYVLSDPEMRRRYDLERLHPNDQAIQVAARADTTRARQAAEDYPKTWSEVEGWFDRITSDFTKAEYDLSGEFPNISNSASGPVFITIGAALGALLAVGLGILSWKVGNHPAAPYLSDAYVQAIKQPPERGFGSWVQSIYLFGILLLFLPPLGAFIAARLHKGIGAAIPSSRRERIPAARDAGAPNNYEASAKNQSSTTMTIIVCERCSQKLRVPTSTSELVVTCGRCGHRFSHAQ